MRRSGKEDINAVKLTSQQKVATTTLGIHPAEIPVH